jgi:hypothetical protein
MLKAGPVLVERLHRMVSCVWKPGKAPVKWRRAPIVPIYKNKGFNDVPGNSRGISLLSIPDKVYASILLHRITSQVEGKHSDAQCVLLMPSMCCARWAALVCTSGLQVA